MGSSIIQILACQSYSSCGAGLWPALSHAGGDACTTKVDPLILARFLGKALAWTPSLCYSSGPVRIVIVFVAAIFQQDAPRLGSGNDSLSE